MAEIKPLPAGSEILLIKTGELALKGLNRGTFEEILLKNLRRRLRGLGDFRLRKAQSTIFIEPASTDIDWEAAAARVGQVFGIAAFSRAAVTEKDLAAICAAAADYLAPQLRGVKTFKVESKRSDKTFPLTSPELSAAVGGYL